MVDEAMPVRTERVRPRRPTRYGRTPRPGTRVTTTTTLEEVPALERDGSSPSRLKDGWHRLRVWWDQTTFYLFSPESWRR